MIRLFTICFALALSFINSYAQKKNVKTYFSSGKLKSVSEVENGKRNGKEELYWQDGSLFMIQYFKNDLPVDTFYQYDEHHPGRILLRGYFTSRSYYVVMDTLGNIVSDGEYTEGMIANGFSRLFYKDGKVAGVTQRENGKKNGVVVSYYNNGNVKQIVHYKNDLKIPPIIEFDSLGKMVKYIPVK